MQLSSQQFEYSECAGCKALFMSRRPVEENVAFYYSSEYQPYQSASGSHRKGRVINLFLARLKTIARKVLGDFIPTNLPKCYSQLPSGAVFVDFGCGAGKTLDLMRTAGHHTVGVDFSPLAIDSVRERGHDAFLGEQFWQMFPDGSADLVRMNHVVEHLYQPRVVLAGIASKLKKGGILHVAVPNPAGISALLFHENWHGLDCPRHVILYPPETLLQLLGHSGFGEFEVRHESISKDFVRSIGYWLAAKGLYNLSKVNALMKNRVMALLLWMPMRICAFSGRGDRFHIICHKL